MKIFNKQKNKGFTLIETMIAVFILTMAMIGLLGLISRSLFTARYSKNDIIANYLIQEAIDSIRNDRDTIAFQKYNLGSWNNFQNKYDLCFYPEGCEIEISRATIDRCDTPNSTTFGDLDCRVLNYDKNASGNGFYTYSSPSGSIPSNFKRQIMMSVNANNADEIDIKVTAEWLNGSLVRSRSSQVSLLNWQQ